MPWRRYADSSRSPGTACPHCTAERVIRHCHANGLQRYLCRACHKTFNALTGTPLSGLHKCGKWLDQAAALHRMLARCIKWPNPCTFT